MSEPRFRTTPTPCSGDCDLRLGPEKGNRRRDGSPTVTPVHCWQVADWGSSRTPAGTERRAARTSADRSEATARWTEDGSAWRDPEEQEMSGNLVEEGRVSQWPAVTGYSIRRSRRQGCLRTTMTRKDWRHKKGAAGRKGASLKWWDSVHPPPWDLSHWSRQAGVKASGRPRPPACPHPGSARAASLRCPILCRGHYQCSGRRRLVFGLWVEPQLG